MLDLCREISLDASKYHVQSLFKSNGFRSEHAIKGEFAQENINLTMQNPITILHPLNVSILRIIAEIPTNILILVTR